jgi:hypothetical protein
VFPHNDYLSYGIAYGVLAGVMYFAVPAWLLMKVFIAKMPGADPRAVAIQLAGVGAGVVLLLNSMTDHLAANRWYHAALWCILWIAYYVSRPIGKRFDKQAVRARRKSLPTPSATPQ